VIPSGLNVSYLVGGGELKSFRPYKPYNDLQCDFLNALSSKLRESNEARNYPDVMSFAFWCRRGNISSLRRDFANQNKRLGIGSIFHIAPANVPINFAYSYAFGLLSGNANFVRLPSKAWEQISVVCNAINSILEQDEFSEIRPLTNIFRYDHQDGVTGEISAKCNGRLIWGGDYTIRKIRESPILERGIDIAFADRYSFCTIVAKKLADLPEQDLANVASGFYNDTYLMDQNACSSPHLVVWLGERSDVTVAQNRFWSCLLKIVKEKYAMSAITAVDKYTLLCQNSIELSNIESACAQNNLLYRVELDSLPQNIDEMRGKAGYFYEYQTLALDDVAEIVNPKYQTLTYFGLEKTTLLAFVVNNRLSGIDRIVPIGAALSIGTIWDGYDIIKSLSRIIDVK
jgi:hypothetical protein